MNPADASLIEQIQQATRGGRALICGLGRRGKALERDEPERAAFLLTAVRSHPLYKGGRLAFDMLELEDLMFDDPPVDRVSPRDLVRAVSGVVERWDDLIGAFRRIGPDGGAGDSRAAKVHVTDERPALLAADPNVPALAPLLPRVRFLPEDDPDLTDPGPELRPSDYLYDLVVLGFLDTLGRAIDASSP